MFGAIEVVKLVRARSVILTQARILCFTEEATIIGGCEQGVDGEFSPCKTLPMVCSSDRSTGKTEI